MSGFAFHPELYEHRGRVLEALDAAGYVWPTNFSSVDVLHEEYGIEISGIADVEWACTVLHILLREFPDWAHHAIRFCQSGPDSGWRVDISRDPLGTAGS